ncbi:hypothetical protein [Absiella sp. AM54-8XD]|nr:hypothetical protein [Absiella sp. AM54-8XD]
MLDFIATPFEMEDLHKLKEAGAGSVVISTRFFLYVVLAILKEKHCRV